MYDLVIRGGTIVTAGSLGIGDLGVAGEKIAQIGGEMRGRQELDAHGKLVLPGGVDGHVHLTSPDDPAPGLDLWVDDFCSGSRAAIAGGVTTLGNMTFQRPGETLAGAIERELALAQHHAAVDFVLHPVLTWASPEVFQGIPQLAAEGHTSLKLFLPFEGLLEANASDILQAMRLAAANGMLALVHCEDGALLEWAADDLLARGRGSPHHYAESRPDYAESAATERAIAMARATGASIYVVHLSSAVALAACRRARTSGLPVYVETRPLYLYLTRELFARPDGAKYTGAPPLREATDVQALWNGLHSGDIQCVGTDHAPWTLSQKLNPALDVRTACQGVAELETLRPMLYSEGVRGGRISLSRFVELTSTNPAKLLGMYPQKGTIAIGSDADLVVWDPAERRVVEGATMESRAGFSVYDGREVRGWPLYTISRGEVVLRPTPSGGHEILAEPGRGRWVRRGKTTAL